MNFQRIPIRVSQDGPGQRKLSLMDISHGRSTGIEKQKHVCQQTAPKR